MSLKKRRIIFIFCALAFFVSVPFLLCYTNGYRWSYELGIYKTGGLYITSPLNGTRISINNVQKKETGIFQSGLFLQNLKPNTYAVLASKEGYWPWSKKLKVREQLVTEARAMLMPQNPKGEIIAQEKDGSIKNPIYQKILIDLQNTAKGNFTVDIEEVTKGTKTSTSTEKTTKTTEIKENPHLRFSFDLKEKLWWDKTENKLWAEWIKNNEDLPYFFCKDDGTCEEKVLILDSIFSVRSIDFYPKRREVVVVSINNGVYAIEIDGRGGRIIQPIYKGKNPVSLVYEKESAIFILETEEKTFMKIILE